MLGSQVSVHRLRSISPFWIALSIWTAAFCVITGMVLAQVTRAIPYGVYAAAGHRWLDSQPLYELETIDGFQYFPQAAVIFSVFARLGSPLGDTAWRALSWYGYAFGVWRLSRQLAPSRAQECFLLASCLAVLCATDSLGNGQANLALASLMLHASADLTEQRFWRATALLTFGVCLKPLMAVMLLLVWAVYPPMLWRIPLALGVAFCLPWCLRDHAYVVRQYSDCWLKLRLCADPDRLFEDLRSLLATFGVAWSNRTFTALRVLGALGIGAMCVWMRRRIARPYLSIFVTALAGIYLMLFNPRTLSSSYVMPIAQAALLEALFVLRRRSGAAITMLGIVICWTINHHAVGWVEHWLRPLAGIVFLGLLVREAFSMRTRTVI